MGKIFTIRRFRIRLLNTILSPLFFVFFCQAQTSLPSPGLVGYWHNWNDASAPYIQLDQVDSRYTIIDLAFAIPRSGTDYDMVFTPAMVTEATLKTQIQALQAQGRKVIISIGGANSPIALSNTTERDQFVLSMGNIISNYGFDGIDIDLEGSSLSVTAGSTIANPVDVPIVNMINAIKSIMSNYNTATGKKLLLTMAPETAFVQGGMSAYSGVWGAYLPLIHALRDQLELLHVQLYNSGTMYGIDGKIYSVGTPDFIVAMSEAVIKGFNTAGGFFTGLAPEKVAVALPACSLAAGSGYISTTAVQSGMNYLLGKGSKAGTYTLQQTGGYPTFGGMMTWSINWDKTTSCGTSYEYAQNYATIFSSSGCAVPDGLIASGILTTSATLNWNSLASANAYTVQYKNSTQTVYQEISSATNSINLSGLTPGMNYVASVRSVCSTGNSAFSAAISFATQPNSSCGTPSQPVVASVEPNSAVVSWSEITGAASYILRYKPTTAVNYTEVVTAGTLYTLSGLTASTSYDVSIQAVCSGGAGAFGTTTSFTTLAPYACTTPGAPSFSNIQAGSATASWRAVKGANAYVYRYRSTGSAQYTQVTVTSTSYAMSGLAGATVYWGSVRVLCNNGQSAFGSESSFTTLSGNGCSSPFTPGITNITNNAATVNWALVTGAQSYVLRYRLSSASVYTEVPVTGNTYTLSGLTAGASYLAGVKSVCSSTASSAFSSDASFTTTGGGGGGCAVPTNLTISGITANAATATWSAVAGAEAYEFLYHIKGSLAYWTNKVVTVTNFAMSGLKAGTLYETKVRARCPGSIWSSMSSNVEFTTVNKFGAVAAEVHPIGEDFSFSVMPTITRDRIHVRYGMQRNGLVPFTIYSLQGVAMKYGRIIPNGWIDVSTLPSGMYIIRVGEHTGKFLVER